MGRGHFLRQRVGLAFVQQHKHPRVDGLDRVAWRNWRRSSRGETVRRPSTSTPGARTGRRHRRPTRRASPRDLSEGAGRSLLRRQARSTSPSRVPSRTHLLNFPLESVSSARAHLRGVGFGPPTRAGRPPTSRASPDVGLRPRASCRWLRGRDARNARRARRRVRRNARGMRRRPSRLDGDLDSGANGRAPSARARRSARSPYGALSSAGYSRA